VTQQVWNGYFLLEVLQDGAPSLREVSTPVEDFDPDRLSAFCDILFDTMTHNKGIGLSAPQVFVNKRIFVLDVPSTDGNLSTRIAVVNPTVLWESPDCTNFLEGCLSFKGQLRVVRRPNCIKVEFRTPRGKRVRMFLKGLSARAFLHELDHLNGIVLSDHPIPLISGVTT
jgi:peptide deformylase